MTFSYGSDVPHGLTPRERQVLHLIASGLTQAQTARRMNVRPGTIDTYLKRIRRKVGTANKADLTRLALELDRAETDH